MPEVRRVPLEGLALQVKLLRPHAPVAAFLAAMMEPPPREARASLTVHRSTELVHKPQSPQTQSGLCSWHLQMRYV